MLDSETKRRIDTARDILVGKVPDPKSQVEQITIALIYKFMDDMDAQAEEIGGKRKFFAGEFAQYGWAKLMAPSVSGEERIALYAEGMVKMPQNPGVPKLFRDIFKNAYLPYRDPETLKAFLKTINGFEYDHSERLGDAFEYLLSVLGSQGDAGQFRTPRHIIDFMVAVVDPKKTETVLDPACGTAGFLISAYKHILRANSTAPLSPSPGTPGEGRGEGSSPNGHKNALNGEAALHTSNIPAARGDKLSPDERKKLADNLRGYDISPDMVRLSLVNMYLHGFTDPHVYEYDSLTSQERWNEMADVILANPPFMSPKGGIKPHNRFSVQSKRSEVLFVDYMAEHLTPGGRAGIIVPEGIIFQSQTAYKTLRKMLVEHYLVAVVSLPSGIFNPYAGVKTSILILDRSLAKQSDTVGFFKVENDGFGLGAQRRPIDKNDLPTVLAEINEYLRRLRAKEPALPPSPGTPGEGRGEGWTPARGLIVSKDKIAANGDYGLSGERYADRTSSTVSWPLVPLREIIDDLESGVSVNSTSRTIVNGESGILKTSSVTDGVFQPEEHKAILPEELSRARCRPRRNSIIISRMNTEALVGANAFVERDYENLFLPDRLWQTVISRHDVAVRYVQFALASKQCRTRISARCGGTSGSMKNISKDQLLSIEIPLPPLEVQKEIVAEVEAYQKVIDGARAVLDHYRPHIPIQPDWPMVALGTVCEDIRTGPFGSLLHQSDYVIDGIPLVNPQDIVDGQISTEKAKTVSRETRDRMQEFTLRERDIVIGRRGEMGRCAIVPREMHGWLCGTGCCIIRVASSCDVRFIAHQLRSPRVAAHLEQHSVGVTMKNLNHGLLNALLIPLPPQSEQERIVSEIEAEQRLVAGNRELIERFEKKIQQTLARIWGEAPTHVGERALAKVGV